MNCIMITKKYPNFNVMAGLQTHLILSLSLSLYIYIYIYTMLQKFFITVRMLNWVASLVSDFHVTGPFWSCDKGNRIIHH